jgi:hypothetical protein
MLFSQAPFSCPRDEFFSWEVSFCAEGNFLLNQKLLVKCENCSILSSKREKRIAVRYQFGVLSCILFPHLS